MTNRPARLVQPRRWSALAASVSVAVAAAPAFADAQLRLPQQHPKPSDAQVWTVQAEGGEGGEAGAIAGASNDAAYLAQLTIVEGHMIAATALYAKGQQDQAVELSRHPEQEKMMDAVRKALAAHGAADFSGLMQDFTATMAKGAPQADVDAALAVFRAGVAAAMAPEAAAVKPRMDAVVAVLKAAADEYAGSIENGAVTDIMAYHEAFAFVGLARAQATALQADAKTAHAAGRALEAMQTADEAFGDMTGTVLKVADPAILLSVAARMELIASSVR